IELGMLPSLFEPFTRARRGAGAPVGSGLGLSISQKLVDAMGGRIDVVSAVGEGTTFTVRLPVDGRPEEAWSHDSGFGGDGDFVPIGPLGGATVLYIEDEPVNAILMEAFFKSLPDTAARLLIAPTAKEGLREAFLLRPDLVLLDMNLPDLDGVSVLRRLRADPRTAHIPVIAVSADALPDQIRSAREAGCDDYWIKPIDFKQVHADLARRFPSVA
ncbi:MAG: response regulator, partial [Burkholderiales bacterium]|nr:response regulator [Burkholderiales bacterium]